MSITRSACRCISSSAATNISTSSGKSFRDFFAGKLAELPGERPTISDWANHLSTIFPEVRLKRYLEMRGADGGPWRRLPSLTAFWVGLLYDDDALDACWDMVKGWSAAERQKLRDDVPKLVSYKEVQRHLVGMVTGLTSATTSGLVTTHCSATACPTWNCMSAASGSHL